MIMTKINKCSIKMKMLDNKFCLVAFLLEAELVSMCIMCLHA